MYIWTIPATENNVLSLRAAKGENGAMTTMTATTTTAVSREHIDSIVGLLIIRRCLTAGQTRIHARKSMIVYLRTIYIHEVIHCVNVWFWKTIHNVVRVRSLSQIINDAHFIPCGAREGLLKRRDTFGPFLTAGYNDRPCCVEIFKISLTVTEAKSNARTSCDGQAIKAIKIVETIGWESFVAHSKGNTHWMAPSRNYITIVLYESERVWTRMNERQKENMRENERERKPKYRGRNREGRLCVI